MWRQYYQPLPQGKTKGGTDAPERPESVTISSGIKALLRFGFLIIAACTVLDCVLFVALGYRYAKIVLFPVDPAKLETRSTYINFDLLYRNGTKTRSQFPPIRALPRVLAQVSSREPDRVFPQWPVSFLAPYGSVPQNDRRLLVDPEISTFVQFRALDYGMENCSLVLRIPEHGSDGAMEMAHIGSTFDVWSLAVNAKVDLLRLSYNVLPRRIAMVGRFTATYNATEQLPTFACESGTYYAFLFTCPEGAHKEDCWVDLTSTKEELVGVYMEQRQTI